MILKVNNKGISINVSMSETLIEKFGTSHATIPIGFISKFRIKPIDEEDNIELLQLMDNYEEEYKIHYSIVTSINGKIGFKTNLEVFNEINLLLFGL